MRRTLFQAAILVVLSLVFSAGVYPLHPRSPAFYATQEPVLKDEVSYEQVIQRWKGEVLWIDARPKEQFDAEHIPGALLLNEQNFDELLLAALDTLQMTQKPVIIYCSGQRCEASRNVRKNLLAAVPLNDCFVLKGGWPSWKEAQKNP